MKKAKNGDHVKVHYSGKKEDGSVFFNSKDREPLEFVIGEGNVIKGMEDGVIGMQVGDQKKIEIPPEDAFGQMKEDLVVAVSENKFPDNVKPISMGQQFQFKSPDGNLHHATVVDVKGDSIVLDANHPLAGETLLIDVEVMEIY
jgi:peptidylprolyl isomerase